MARWRNMQRAERSGLQSNGIETKTESGTTFSRSRVRKNFFPGWAIRCRGRFKSNLLRRRRPPCFKLQARHEGPEVIHYGDRRLGYFVFRDPAGSDCAVPISQAAA